MTVPYDPAVATGIVAGIVVLLGLGSAKLVAWLVARRKQMNSANWRPLLQPPPPSPQQLPANPLPDPMNTLRMLLSQRAPSFSAIQSDATQVAHGAGFAPVREAPSAEGPCWTCGRMPGEAVQTGATCPMCAVRRS